MNSKKIQGESSANSMVAPPREEARLEKVRGCGNVILLAYHSQGKAREKQYFLSLTNQVHGLPTPCRRASRAGQARRPTLLFSIHQPRRRLVQKPRHAPALVRRDLRGIPLGIVFFLKNGAKGLGLVRSSGQKDRMLRRQQHAWQQRHA